MSFDFLLLFGQLKLAFLFSEKKKKVIKKFGLLETKAIKIFEFRKKNNRYWNGAKLYK